MSDDDVEDVLTSIDEITGALMHVITSARQELVLVSPYIQIEVSKSKRWKTLQEAMQGAIDRGVQITFISRTKDEYNSTDIMTVLKPFRDLGCSVFLVDHLHAKIYYNEHEAVVTSLNLYMGSTIGNWEIGARIVKPAKLAKVRDHVCGMIGAWGKRSVGGGRSQSREPAPTSGQGKQTWFSVSKVGTKLYTIKLEGKWPGTIDKNDVPVKLVARKSYTCTATTKWMTTRKGSKRCYLASVIDVVEKKK